MRMSTPMAMLVVIGVALVACGGGESGNEPVGSDGRVTAETTGGGPSTAPPTTSPTSTSPSSSSPSSSSPSSSSPSPETTVAPTTALLSPQLDLDDEPFLFFGPVSEPPPDKVDFPLPKGSADYFELFDDGADWQEALAELDAFKIHFWQARYYLSDEDLVRISDFLDRHDIPLIIEAEPLDPPDPDECDHTESFEGPYELEQARRLADLGVEVAAIAIEQPYHYAFKLEGPGACRYELGRILDEVVTWVGDMREIFPGVEVGTIEGFWADPPTTSVDYETWLDSYEAAAGEPFAFVHIDIDWARPDWVEGVLAIEDVVEARDVPFGVIFNGGAQATTSDEWIRLAAEHFADYLRAGGSPGHIGFQSWQDLPDRVLPDSDATAFSNLIVRVLGDDARFESAPAFDPALGVTGRLVAVDGSPLAGRTVSADVVPTGPVRRTFVDEHVVPTEAAESLVAIRVNTADAVRGASDTTIHSITVGTAGGEQLVANPSFDDGLAGWGVYDDNGGTTSAVSTSEGSAMRLQAGDAEVINIDGSRYRVTPGDTLELTVDAAFDASGGSVDVVVIHFDDGPEIARYTTSLRAGPQPLGSATTDIDGGFAIPTGGLSAGDHTISVTTADDPHTWPVTTTVPVTLGV